MNNNILNEFEVVCNQKNIKFILYDYLIHVQLTKQEISDKS